MAKISRSYKAYLPHFIIIAFAFVIYGNTLFYDYTLDDLIVIKENAFTTKGIEGLSGIFKYDSFTGFFGVQKTLVAGGRYRPLSIATFAIEYQLFGGFNPFFSRLINILLYGMTGALIFIVFSKLFSNKPVKKWHLTIPFVAAVLFIAHPVHTEVVANIKGRDEIFTLFFSMCSLWCALLYLDHKKFRFILLSAISFFLGLLSKENAIMFLFIIPLTIYFFTKHPLKSYFSLTLVLLFTALVFLFIRFLVLGYLNSPELPKELLNNPFLFATGSQKVGTILFTLGLYVKLLFFPHPLTHDYYPYHIPLVDFTDIRSVIPLLLYLAMIVYAIVNIKKKAPISYGILFYLSTLFIVSNLLFSVGTFMNERFIYMPSIGFVFIISYFLVNVLHKLVKSVKPDSGIIQVLLLLLLIPYSVKTITRNTAWKNDFTLFSTDVKTSENSLKCNTSAGGKFLEKAQMDPPGAEKEQDFQFAFKYLQKAVSIYPYNNNSLILLANARVFYQNDYKGAIDLYMRVLSFDPYDKNAFGNLFKVLPAIDDARETDYKLGILLKLNNLHPDDSELNRVIGKLYGQYKGNLDSAAFYLVKATTLSPENPVAFKDLGIVYGMQHDYDRALQALQTALKLDPNDAQIRQNISITYHMIEQNKGKSTGR
jgi:tetratricopeptide (TPR) repeat protein